MDLKVTSATFGAGAKFSSKPRVHQRQMAKGSFTDKAYKYAGPAGWLLLLGFLTGSVFYYGIKDMRQRYTQALNPTEIVNDALPRDTLTITQE